LSRLRAKVPKKASDPFSYAIFGTFALSRDNTIWEWINLLSTKDFMILDMFFKIIILSSLPLS